MERKFTFALSALVAVGATIGGCQYSGIRPANPEVSSPVISDRTEVNQLESVAEPPTGPQGNAVRSARQYLSLKGFSRDGLIEQLSSNAGDKYDVRDATLAVDSLNVDWDMEAVRSAKQYLSMMGFSCDGLIEQLSSSAGEKFTIRQATYGAQQSGACR